MLRQPGAFTDYVLGSPSVAFDPEILDDVARFEPPPPPREPLGALVLVGAREREGKRLPANVHDDLVGGAERLASVLRARGVRVDGVVEVPGEDHGTVKFALVSRGLMWLARRATRGAAPYDEMT